MIDAPGQTSWAASAAEMTFADVAMSARTPSIVPLPAAAVE
jgi:hypothetical protein